jgi:hydrogenase-1 operon protein HyaF
MHTFPIPVVALGPGTQPEDESLNYMDMPHDMRTYRMPVLPEPEDVRDLRAARGVLQAVLAGLQPSHPDLATARIDLSPLDAANLALIDQIMGEGEVSALIESQGGSLRIQESVYAGVWRTRLFDADAACIADHIEIGDLPAAVVRASRAGQSAPIAPPLAPGVVNAPALLAEISDHLRQATPYHIINLSLLPFSPEDALWLDQALGRGTVSLLSRGYGNCRITATGISRVWWVQYFNSQDALILNTLEITDAPEVARAAVEDLADSVERLAEVMEWIG